MLAFRQFVDAHPDILHLEKHRESDEVLSTSVINL